MSWRTGFRKSLVYLVAIVAGFSLAYLLVAFVIFPAGVIPRDVKVPNVMGLGFDEAAQRLAQAGFKSERGEQRYNNSAPKMTVLEQSPPPGAREGIGATVTLVVSGGQRMVGVPTVTGMTRIEAQVLLEKEGFDVGDVQEAQSNAPPGTVIGTRPAAGSAVSVPSTGLDRIEQRYAGAIDARSHGTRRRRGAPGAHADRREEPVDRTRAGRSRRTGTVVGQTPVSGATIAPGMTVTLRVVAEPTPPPREPPPEAAPPPEPEPVPPPVQQP
jgi:serine/threonine-protein kinase